MKERQRRLRKGKKTRDLQGDTGEQERIVGIFTLLFTIKAKGRGGDIGRGVWREKVRKWNGNWNQRPAPAK